MIFDFRNNIYETDKWGYESAWSVYNEEDVNFAMEMISEIGRYPFTVKSPICIGSDSRYFATKEEAEAYKKDNDKTDNLIIEERDISKYKEIINKAEDKYAILTLYFGDGIKVCFKFYKTEDKDNIEAVRRNLSAAIRSENKVFCWTGDYEEM